MTMDDPIAARRRWRRIYLATALYGVATLVVLWAFARAYRF